MAKANCPRCGYEWEARVKKPVACPRCKVRFDVPVKKAAK